MGRLVEQSEKVVEREDSFLEEGIVAAERSFDAEAEEIADVVDFEGILVAEPVVLSQPIFRDVSVDSKT